MFQFSPAAHWIWTRENAPPRNSFVCFRRSFQIGGEVEDAVLEITADARYDLFCNGEWLGSGPPRSWPEPLPVDEYDLRAALRRGWNSIAVLVHDFGISTFQYIKSKPGFLAQLHFREGGVAPVGGAVRAFASDENWRAKVHPAFAWSTPRINVQTGWEEQFDARLDWRDEDGHDWRAADFDDSTWPNAKSMRSAGTAPHETFEKRTIPFLTREIVEPVRVAKTELVQTAPINSSFSLRHVLNAKDPTANYLHGRMLAVTHLVSESAQEIELHFPIGAQGFEWKLNGSPLPPGEATQLTDHPVYKVSVQAGINTLMGRPPQTAHSWRFSLNVWAKGLQLRALPDGETKSHWLALGPFADTPAPADLPGILQMQYVTAAETHPEATGEKWEELWARGEITPEECEAPYARPLTAGEEFALDVFAVCAGERVLPTKPVLREACALMRDSGDWTTIFPVPDGGEEDAADTRFLFDFGDEIIGHFEFEVDAPEGTILDWQGFEFIQRDGRTNLCDLMNNTFRYVCREGAQRYRTFTRRGFRFCFLSIRNASRPVSIRFVRAILNTYPTTHDGDFACSDALLERIWHVGAHSVRACAEDAYTDCPAYEQVFWVGDARNEAIVDLIVNGDPRLSAHCWLLAARSLERTPLVEATAPSGRPLILPAWTFLWMRWAYEHFWLTGDREFAKKALPYMERNIAGIEAHLNERDLFEITAWNMFDWAPMDTPPSGIVTHQNCLAVLGLRQNAELARLVDEPKLAARWDALGDRLAAAINRHLWSEESAAYIDCIHADGTPSKVLSQQTQTAAYIAGVAGAPFGSKEREERCRAIIDDAPEDFVSAGSPFFMFFALEAFERQKRTEKLLDAIRDYWGPQIEAGATTFWEMYHPHQPRLTRSHCHGWSAAPTFFLTRHVLGASPLEPGYNTVRISPGAAGVSWAQGRIPTPRGVIEIYWKREGEPDTELFLLRLELPPQTCARIELPYAGKLLVSQGEVQKLESTNTTTRLETTSPSLTLSLHKEK